MSDLATIHQRRPLVEQFIFAQCLLLLGAEAVELSAGVLLFAYVSFLGSLADG